jgi:pyruvate kinase
MKQTKIICTLGPSSESVEKITALVKNGMNVARLNFSHGTYENHSLLMRNVREVSQKLGVPVAIMQDLQGPKIRVGKLDEPVKIKAGQMVVLGKEISLDYDISGSVKPKERILIEDGTIELKVKSVKGKFITCEVITAGLVQSHKGINLPDSVVTFPIMTEKDKKDLMFGLEHDVDFVAFSFVRHAKDVADLKKLIAKHNPKGYEVPKVVAKIERPEAVEGFDAVLAETDVVMVARGDLGVEIEDSLVPVVQKMIIQKCLEVAKPVIVATQMLDSMIRNPRPTRAEVSDVANAVFDETDCVMLSGESAFGQYPVETVREMNAIVETAEASPYRGGLVEFIGTDDLMRVSAVAKVAVELADLVEARAIVTFTFSGVNARMLSRERPGVPIMAITNKPKRFRQLQMVWGVVPVLMHDFKNIDKSLEEFLGLAKKHGWLQSGDRVVVASGKPVDEKMNMVEVKSV